MNHAIMALFLELISLTNLVSQYIRIKILQWVKHENPLKDPQQFFETKMLTKLNDSLCQSKEMKMLGRDFHFDYAARMLEAKYDQVNTNKVAAD